MSTSANETSNMYESYYSALSQMDESMPREEKWGTQTIADIAEFAEEKHDSIFDFRNTTKLHRRIRLYEKIREVHPNTIPIIIGCRKRAGLVLQRKKFLCRGNMPVGMLLAEVRKSVANSLFGSNLGSHAALFLFTEDNTLPAMSQLLQQVHERHGNRDDGFLYLMVEKENVFG